MEGGDKIKLILDRSDVTREEQQNDRHIKQKNYYEEGKGKR